MDDEWIGQAVPDFDRLVDEGVRLGGLLGDGVNGVLEMSRSRRAKVLVEGPLCDLDRPRSALYGAAVPARFRRPCRKWQSERNRVRR